MSHAWPTSPAAAVLYLLIGALMFACLGRVLAASAARLSGPRESPLARGAPNRTPGSGRPESDHGSPVSGLEPVASQISEGGGCVSAGIHARTDSRVIGLGSVAAFLVGVAAIPEASWQLVAGLLGAVLLTLAMIDLRHGVLPDVLLLALALLGCGLAWRIPAAGVDLPAALTGAALGGGTLWAVRASYQWFRGVEGLGLGDVKLAAVGGLWLGWEGLPLMILTATLSTLAWLGLRALAGRRTGRHDPIPLGPGLAFGLYLTALGGFPLRFALGWG